MTELNVNESLSHLLANHGLSVMLKDGFIEVQQPFKAKFKATAHHTPIKNIISSRLDITVVTEDSETIIECFGDFGTDVETAVNNNFRNFSSGSLHPLLAALGSRDEQTLHQITEEEWKINGKRWTAYIGNISVKTNDENLTRTNSTDHFFEAIETGIKLQTLNNGLCWFRGYYLQGDNSIVAKEFLMNNEQLPDADKLLSEIVIAPNVSYYSLRIFIVLKQVRDSLQANKSLHNNQPNSKSGDLFSWFRKNS